MSTSTSPRRSRMITAVVAAAAVGVLAGSLGTMALRDGGTESTATPSAESSTATTAASTDGQTVELAHDVSGSGPLVVLIHGITEDRRSWDPVTPQLAESATVLRVDLRGHGESPAAPTDGDYRPTTLAADVHAVVEQYAEDDQAPIVIGHSLGGIVATAYASDFPTEAVVNVDQPLELGAMQGNVLAMEDDLRSDAFNDTMLGMFAGMYGDLDQNDVTRLDAIRSPNQDAVLGIWGVLLDLDAEELTAVVEDYSTIPEDVRYLSVQGMAVPEDYPAWLDAQIPQNEYQVWGEVGHYPHLIEQDRFVELVSEVVAGS
ncbi:alpha/beta hydrolase [Cellulomonas sp. NPDC089187]|uniref:alpha/beta fold hydrolase n=1 Tax=Cellulomonas sp. NPDC089187 TaxID=3154970 RepID=UPI00341B0B29